MSSNNCPECGSANLERNIENRRLELAAGLYPAITLEVEVPVYSCSDCGFSFIDAEVEDIQTKAMEDYYRSQEGDELELGQVIMRDGLYFRVVDKMPRLTPYKKRNQFTTIEGYTYGLVEVKHEY